MASLNRSMADYTDQVRKGTIRDAYQGLMRYIASLKTHFTKKHPDYSVSGIYQGNMDLTFFTIMPPAIKQRKLKIPIVFVHEACHFEIWLSGGNKKIQAQYWQLIQDSDWNQYRQFPHGKHADSILEPIVIDDIDFDDLEALTQQIEAETLQFVANVENFLAGQKDAT